VANRRTHTPQRPISSNTHARAKEFREMSETGLKPRRYPQGDLFIIDALDVALKDDMASMEHPIYSLSKKPEKEVEPIEYNDTKIEFRASEKGFPTIYDKDLIIYAISQVIAEMGEPKEGEEPPEPPREIEFDPIDFLMFTERSTGGRAYDALVDCADRLHGSAFRTNATINGQISDEWRHLVADVKLISDAVTKKPIRMKIGLSSMMRETIKTRQVLTLNKDYFRLRKPIERRVYEIARKHVGDKSEWKIGLNKLQKKSGSRSTLREFRRTLKEIAEANKLPDFEVAFDPERDQVIFTSRAQYIKAFKPDTPDLPPLATWAIEKAKDMLPRGVSPYEAESDWRDHWVRNGCLELENHNAAFLGFCKKVKE